MMLREQGGYLIAKRQLDQIAVERAIIEQSIENDLAERKRREDEEKPQGTDDGGGAKE